MVVLLSLLCAAALSTVFVVAAHAEPGLQSDLTAISGQGAGHVLVSPTAKDRPTFAVEVEVNVQDMLPNSTFTVERRVDLTPDGVCTSATWLTNGPITTSDGGARRSSQASASTSSFTSSATARSCGASV